MRTRARRAGLAAALLAATPVAAVAHAAPAPTSRAATVAPWHVDLSAGATSAMNVRRGGASLRVGRASVRPAALRGDRGYATEILPPHTVPTRINTVGATIADRVPAGARVSVAVRGRLGAGAWSEWSTVADGRAVRLGRAADRVQARVELWTNAAGASPTLSGLTLSAAHDATAPDTANPQAAETYTVFATDEGLVGGTTANGHVVQPNDHFVALPSGRALSPDGSDEYSVRVCYNGTCQTDPVWDTGPWNVQDNYWDPAAQRQEFADVPQGTPEAQDAYDNGYNNGEDDEGRQISNPSGIDLADGAFQDLGLPTNEYVQVTYLWTGGSAR